MIEPVKEIPVNPGSLKESRREQLRADLAQAHKAGPGKYELTGDYNYSYLRQALELEAE